MTREHVHKDGTWYIELTQLRTQSTTVFERLDPVWREQRGWRAIDPSEVWFALDRLDLERVHPPESDDERYQRVERLAQQYTAELLACRPTSCVRCSRSVAADSMREGRCAECAVGMPMVAKGDDVGLRSELEATIQRLACDSLNSVNVAVVIGDLKRIVARMPAAPATPTLTSAEWAALEQLRDAVRSDRVYVYLNATTNTGRSNRFAVASIIDKLRSHAPQPLHVTDPNAAACTRDCDASCNSECGCGSTHHHCGCECHRADERRALGGGR